MPALVPVDFRTPQVDARAAVAGLAKVARQRYKEHDFAPRLGFPHGFIFSLGVGARMGTVCGQPRA